MKLKIVVTKDLKFYPDQIKRLESLGQVIYHKKEAKTADEWLERCKEANIICTGLFGFNSDKLYQLRNVFITLPFVGIEFLDKKKLKEKNIVVANSPGCNKESVTEWIIGMLLMNFRRLNLLTRRKDLSREEALQTDRSLFNKKIIILGNGHIGKQLGKICKVFGMQVNIFKRGDNILEKVKDADIIANCLSANESSINLLDKKMFMSLKKGSFFISVTKPQVYDLAALKEALDKGILSGAADDAGGANIGDTKDPQYKELLKHPKIIVTPHIAWNSEAELRKSNDIMIDNIVAWIKHKPINLVR